MAAAVGPLIAPLAVAQDAVPTAAGDVADRTQTVNNPPAVVDNQPTIVDIDLPPADQFDLFLLVGQSNMAGRGRLTDADRQPPERVLTFTADRIWQPAIDPIHFDKPKVAGVGLGRTFGIEVAARTPGRTIGLIPCAIGGSPIADWQPGAFHSQTKTHPWDDAIARAQAAMQHGTLRGILWHQGEGDGNEARAPLYEAKLHELVQRFRDALDAPDVPFIVGQLGQFPERPWNQWRKQVDQAHRNLPKLIPNTAFVSSDGLVHGGDRVHFDADSCRELGRRYAAAYFDNFD